MRVFWREWGIFISSTSNTLSTVDSMLSSLASSSFMRSWAGGHKRGCYRDTGRTMSKRTLTKLNTPSFSNCWMNRASVLRLICSLFGTFPAFRVRLGAIFRLTWGSAWGTVEQLKWKHLHRIHAPRRKHCSSPRTMLLGGSILIMISSERNKFSLGGNFAFQIIT